MQLHVLSQLPHMVAEAGIRRDDYVDDIERGIAAVARELEQVLPTRVAQELAELVASQVDAHSRQQVTRQIVAMLGVEPPTSTAATSTIIRAWRRENVSLSTSVTRSFLDSMEQVLLRGLRARKGTEELRDDLTVEHRKARNRAVAIADDQTKTLNGQLTAQRHGDLGIERYRWRNSRDERVRGRPDGKWAKAKHSHWHREGVIYRYDDPPEDGNPGEPPRCRCWAEPVFEDILGPEFAIDQTPAPIAGAAKKILPGKKRSPARVPEGEDEELFRYVDAWVHGSKSKPAVIMKRAAIDEFGLEGTAFSRRKYQIDDAEVERARRVVRELYRRTQEHFRRRGVKTVRLYRGIKEHYAHRGSLESWTTDRRQARRFAGKGYILEREVPVEQILTGRGIPGWHDGRFGNQSEMVVMF